MTIKTKNTYFAKGFLVKRDGDFRVWAISPTYKANSVDDLRKQIACDFETNENWAGGVFKVLKFEGRAKVNKREIECGVPISFIEYGELSVDELRRARKLAAG